MTFKILYNMIIIGYIKITIGYILIVSYHNQNIVFKQTLSSIWHNESQWITHIFWHFKFDTYSDIFIWHSFTKSHTTRLLRAKEALSSKPSKPDSHILSGVSCGILPISDILPGTVFGSGAAQSAGKLTIRFGPGELVGDAGQDNWRWSACH